MWVLRGSTGVCPRGGGRSIGGVCRQLDAMQEAATPVKAFLSDALGGQPHSLSLWPDGKKKPKPAVLSTGTGSPRVLSCRK